MKTITHLCLMALIAAGCSSKKSETPVTQLPQEEVAVFTSTDKALEDAYTWAQKTALGYSHDGTDSVGYWYEAALPQREAFCMRDVSHQSVGAQVLGLGKHNRNMFMRFAENISENKDWCTYWEINRYNCPAPADYTNDQEFWYNLNANFDVIQACWKMYQWTADSTYLYDSCLSNFYDKSLDEYVVRWKLQPDSLMNRPRFMNSPEKFDPHNNFHTCRGLASYVENFPGLTASADLIATLYAGYEASARMASVRNDHAAVQRFKTLASQYRQLLEERWWSNELNSYYTFWTEEQKFHKGEGESFVVWFNATERAERIRATIHNLLNHEWNVETLSYFPTLLYRYGYDYEAYDKLTSLPRMNRAEYPEVSFGIVEGVAGGVMGIEPSAVDGRITTLSRLSKQTDHATLSNVPVFGGYITVEHDGRKKSQFTNLTGKTVVWRAAFCGNYPSIKSKDKEQNANVFVDVLGNETSYIDIEVPANETRSAEL
ncbi:hypothetical protein [uncultured Bacteroides sp.]|uniref:hypothetical protein n=1 Tax=uncultured Bacteroides sp. TaxID=162156 RepID=UPI0025FC172B|nr:hypothetical protein [uncultured Bacteroides sp.]